MPNINQDRVDRSLERDGHRMIWRPYGLPTVLDLERTAFHDGEISRPWDIPDKLVVSVAITGAFFQLSQNPHQPITPVEIRESARECMLAGASTVHIHVRDDAGYNTLSEERFQAVISPLKAEFPDLAIDGCMVPALPGEWDSMVRVIQSGLLEGVPVNTTMTYLGDSLFAKPAAMMIEKTRLVLEAGGVPELAVYTDADVSNADRYLFKSGLLTRGAVWLILPALPGCSPMDNPRQMLEGLHRTVGAIRDVDAEAIIFVCAAGRAAMNLATVAAAAGLHIRVGMEDTYWKWAHRDDRITSNVECLSLAQQLSNVVGRPVATPAEYRAMLGLSPVVSTSGQSAV